MTQNLEQIPEITISVSDFLNAVDRLAKGAEIYHTIKSACLKLDISRSTFEKWRKEGRLPEAVEVNGFDRYRESDLESMILHQNPHLLGLENSQVNKDAAQLVASL